MRRSIGRHQPVEPAPDAQPEGAKGTAPGDLAPHSMGQPRVLPPSPRPPLDATLAPAPGSRRRERRPADAVDRSGFDDELNEVAVWTASDGAWQEHATFLLRTTDGTWRAVGFAEPAATELVGWLRQLPGFDATLLWEVIGQPVRRIVSLWHRPEPDERSD